MAADSAGAIAPSEATSLAQIDRLPGIAKPDPILEATGVKRRFGGVVAVDVEKFSMQRGAITALIGPNGAGKTTFFNLLTGFDGANSGAWSLDGTLVAEVPASSLRRSVRKVGYTLGFNVPGPRPLPHRLAHAGMVRTFQLTKALTKMSVIDNMLLGAAQQRGEKLMACWLPPLWREQEAEITQRADALLERFKLDHMREEYAGSLSGGQRKLLEMARALMASPKLVMLDEPMAGVNPALTESLLGHVKALRDDGVSVLFVEHDMDVVRDISDWVVVMAEGRIIAEGTHADIGANPAVIDAYLGAHHGEDLEGSVRDIEADRPTGETPEIDFGEVADD